MIEFNDENDTKWWSFELGWKWPHEGFTIGWDIIEPYDDPDYSYPEDIYYTVVLYLGPLSLIYKWGKNEQPNEEEEIL